VVERHGLHLPMAEVVEVGAEVGAVCFRQVVARQSEQSTAVVVVEAAEVQLLEQQGARQRGEERSLFWQVEAGVGQTWP